MAATGTSAAAGAATTAAAGAGAVVDTAKAGFFDIWGALKGVKREWFNKGTVTELKDAAVSGGGKLGTVAALPVKMAGGITAAVINTANKVASWNKPLTVAAAAVATLLVANKWRKSAKANNALEAEQLNMLAQQGAAHNSNVEGLAYSDEYARLQSVLAQGGKQNVGQFTNAHLSGQAGQQVGQQL